jgi:hypothetical protein
VLSASLGGPVGTLRHDAGVDADIDDPSYASFSQAQASPAAVAVLSGDYGGTIYLTVPMARVRCTEEQLNTLLSDLDAIHCMGGAEYQVRVTYHDVPVPGHIAGGDGGGEVIDGVWTHPSWIDDEIATLANEVIAGRRARLPGRLLRQRRAERLAQRRQRRESQPPVMIRGQELPWNFDVVEPVEPFPDTED